MNAQTEICPGCGKAHGPITEERRDEVAEIAHKRSEGFAEDLEGLHGEEILVYFENLAVLMLLHASYSQADNRPKGVKHALACAMLSDFLAGFVGLMVSKEDQKAAMEFLAEGDLAAAGVAGHA